MSSPKRCSEFEEFGPNVVDSYETLSGVGKVVCKQELLNEDLPSLKAPDSLTYDEVLVENLDLQVRRLRNKEVASIKVLWRSQSVEGATWEAEAAIKAKYSHLFPFDSISSSVKDGKGYENQVANHLSRIEADTKVAEGCYIDDAFPDESIIIIFETFVLRYDDYANFIVCGLLPDYLISLQRGTFYVKKYIGDEPLFFIECADNIIRCCLPEVELQEILEACHAWSASGLHVSIRITSKVLQYGYYYYTMFRDFHAFCKFCVQCQMQGSIFRRHELPMSQIPEIELFDVWRIDFMGPFPSSFGKKIQLTCSRLCVQVVGGNSFIQ
ncbi:hypothetical protein MTR67_043439 [Solanum verrucosum]|uniref:Integrase zinc-binding domain-containing protein n=1 Tax=Solanum verrucosum TaxID=315347 RepID=A0AAF0URQ2_SOLVR|nr:hypothetical protein MTR67_043439 [Solanum verrucosum]